MAPRATARSTGLRVDGVRDGGQGIENQQLLGDHDCVRRARIISGFGWLMIAGGFLLPTITCCLGATIPDQDPTPEMAQQFNQELAESERLIYLGLAAGAFLLLAGIGIVVRTAMASRRSRRT
jgi:hypothetical protein